MWRQDTMYILLTKGFNEYFKYFFDQPFTFCERDYTTLDIFNTGQARNNTANFFNFGCKAPAVLRHPEYLEKEILPLKKAAFYPAEEIVVPSVKKKPERVWGTSLLKKDKPLKLTQGSGCLMK